MNGYVQEFLREMAGQAVTVTVSAAHEYGRVVAAQYAYFVGPMRLSSIDWQLEHDLECIDQDLKATKQQERKLS